MPMLEIAYTPIWFDYPVSDGTYTPKQLRKAGLQVYHTDSQTYALRWPGGQTQPPRAAPPQKRTTRPTRTRHA